MSITSIPNRRYYGWPVRFKLDEKQKCIESAEANGRSYTNTPKPKHGYLYRFDWSNDGHYMQLFAFPIIKITPKGVRIAIDPYGGTKWIMGSANKFASDTVDKAITSYKRRKECYISILKSRLKEVRRSLRAADPPKDQDIARAFLMDEDTDEFAYPD